MTYHTFQRSPRGCDVSDSQAFSEGLDCAYDCRFSRQAVIRKRNISALPYTLFPWTAGASSRVTHVASVSTLEGLSSVALARWRCDLGGCTASVEEGLQLFLHPAMIACHVSALLAFASVLVAHNHITLAMTVSIFGKRYAPFDALPDYSKDCVNEVIIDSAQVNDCHTFECLCASESTAAGLVGSCVSAQCADGTEGSADCSADTSAAVSVFQHFCSTDGSDYFSSCE
jgi:hypothetical protein